MISSAKAAALLRACGRPPTWSGVNSLSKASCLNMPRKAGRSARETSINGKAFSRSDLRMSRSSRVMTAPGFARVMTIRCGMALLEIRSV